MKRRNFLTASATAFPTIFIRSGIASGSNLPSEIKTDVAIVGASTGGCAAALAALRNGMRVVMTEETDWIGGQLTSQGVPPDEHPWIERFGCTASYRQYRNAVRDYYRKNYPLTAEALRTPNLNPGSGGVSRICHEPRVSLAVLRTMLAPYLSSRQLILVLEHIPVSTETDGDRIKAVTVQSVSSGDRRTLLAPYFIDATELGDLLPLSGTEYMTGAESQEQTGEKHAASEPQPHNIQAGTWCFAMDYIEGENHTIEKPEQYDFWRNYIPDLTPPWPGNLLSWTYTNPSTLKPRTLYCDPIKESNDETFGFWRYRRIADKRNFLPGTYASDITLVNWPQNDYLLGNFYEASHEERAKHLEGARQLSLSLLYWMQTEAPQPGGKTGLPGLRLRGDILGTNHGMAKYPYIREARRIQAEFTITEKHVGTEMRMEITGKSKAEVEAEPFHDSVGIGSYRIDLHPSTGGNNYIDISSLPFQIPLGALIPVRMKNLIPACKNLGVTHITNGCYRLHPVEWNIGEAAGMLAAFCIKNNEYPRGIRNTEKRLQNFQRLLDNQGIERNWPKTRAL